MEPTAASSQNEDTVRKLVGQPSDTAVFPNPAVLRLGVLTALAKGTARQDIDNHPLSMKLPMGNIRRDTAWKGTAGEGLSGSEVVPYLPRKVVLAAAVKRRHLPLFKNDWCFFCAVELTEDGLEATLAHRQSTPHLTAVAACPYRLATAYCDIYDIVSWLSRSTFGSTDFKSTTLVMKKHDEHEMKMGRYQTGLDRVTPPSLHGVAPPVQIASIAMPEYRGILGEKLYITPVLTLKRPFDGTLIFSVTDWNGKMQPPNTVQVTPEGAGSKIEVPYELINFNRPGTFLVMLHIQFVGSNGKRGFQRLAMFQITWCSRMAAEAEALLLLNAETSLDDTEESTDPRWHPDSYQMPPVDAKDEGIVPMVFTQGIPIRRLPGLFNQWKGQFWPINDSRRIVQFPKGRNFQIEDELPEWYCHFDVDLKRDMFQPIPISAINFAKRSLAEAYGQAVYSDINLPMTTILLYKWYLRSGTEVDEPDRIVVEATVPTAEFELLKVHGDVVRMIIPTASIKAFAVITKSQIVEDGFHTNLVLKLSPYWRKALEGYTHTPGAPRLRLTSEAGIPSQFIIRLYVEMLSELNAEVPLDAPSEEVEQLIKEAELTAATAAEEFPVEEAPEEMDTDGEHVDPDDGTDSFSRKQHLRLALAASYRNVHVPFMVKDSVPEIHQPSFFGTAKTSPESFVDMLASLKAKFDPAQLKVLEAVEGDNRLVICDGPPGTGKSSTLAALMLLLSLRHPFMRILALTPTNQSANVLALKLVNMIEEIDPEHLEGEKTDIFMRYVCAKYPTHLLDESILSYLNNDTTSIGTILKRNIILATVDIGIIHFVNCLDFFPGSSPVGARVKSHFDLVIIDESANLSVPRGLLASLLSAGGRLLLVGDDKQLPAFVTDPVSLAGGASESFLELKSRMARATGHGVIVRLTNNYRSRVEIITPSNEVLYADSPLVAVKDTERRQQLQADVDRNEELRLSLPTTDSETIPYGLNFYTVTSDDVQHNNASRYNTCQADAAMQMIRNLTSKGIQPSRILLDGVYATQVKLLNIMLKMNGWYPAIRAQTANTLQGGEGDIVIITLVRGSIHGDRLGQLQLQGFLNDERRLNVSLTRARLATIVIGHPLRFTTHPLLKRFLHYCCKHGSLRETSQADWSHVHYMACELPRLPTLELDSEAMAEHYNELWIPHTMALRN